MLSIGGVPLRLLIADLEASGIQVTARQRRPIDGSAYICRRGWVRFALDVFPDSEPGTLFVVISADLSRWRWWNFPFLWLASIPFMPWEVRLLRDAYAVLRARGARCIGGR